MASLRRSHGGHCLEKAAVAPAALANPKDDRVLNKAAAHTQHIGERDGALAMAGTKVTAKVKKHVVVPVEEEVQVPVVRKEKVKTMGKKVVQCQRLVPVTRYKEVEETTLETREEVVNGRREKRAIPITQKRMQPYQDFEEQTYEMVINVPMEEVVTRTGMRTDKHVTSKIIEVEQDNIYELRPVLVGKGEKRERHIGDHHKFKHEHGKPEWNELVDRGWLGKPQTPEYKPHLHRPKSSCSVLGSKFDRERTMLHSSMSNLSNASGWNASRPGTNRPMSRTGTPALGNSASDTMLRNSAY